MDNADERLREIRDHMAHLANVKNLMENEFEILERGHQHEDEEPVATFSVKLPVSDLGTMERIGAYFGHKKTPFASMLLQAAIEDAWWGLLQAAEERGKREEVAQYFQERHELEDGNGYTQRKGLV